MFTENNSNTYKTKLSNSKIFLQNKKFNEAEKLLLELYENIYPDYQVPELLIRLYLYIGESLKAKNIILKLIKNHNEQNNYLLTLTNLLLQANMYKDSIICYQKILLKTNNKADVYYNLGFSYKKLGNYKNTIKYYNLALDHKVNQPEEVCCNLGNVYRETKQFELSEKFFRMSLEFNPSYNLASMNLAKLFEEINCKDKALNIYYNLIKINPLNCEALSLIVNMTKIKDRDDELIKKLFECRNENISNYEREGIEFSLGKSFNDCGIYDEAFEHYINGNELILRNNKPFNKLQFEGQISDIIKRNYIPQNVCIKDKNSKIPIFICGMFRSGSTLLEQVLSSHKEIEAGGEMRSLSKVINKIYPNFTKQNLKKQISEIIANSYLEETKSQTTFGKIKTDKMLNNFMYIGIIKSIYPNAKIIITKRNMFDNFLSIYFQRFTNEINYSSSLFNIVHYYKQYTRLINHWLGMYGQELYIFDYDKFVENQESETKSLLEYCDLEWDENCLSFQSQNNSVNTASIWQVRQPLYTTSSGRWKNYEPYITSIINMFES